MSYLDKNKIFFGLLHYIFSEQANVDWAFRTSLVNFTGINETVSQRKYKNDSISNDIIKYVKDVKPYHVQFDHYIEKFTSKDDIAKIISSDSYFPTIKVRYDSVAVKPDIDYHVYTAVYEEPRTDIKQTEKELRYLNLQEKNVYILKKDKHGTLYWKYESTANYGDVFYVEDINTVGTLSLVTNEYDVQYNDITPFSKEELLKFENTSSANRIFLYKTHDFDLIKDYLNAHYKGITISDTSFDINRLGYDAFLYDLKRYDEPTITNAYCLIYALNTQIPVGSSVLDVDYNRELRKDEIIITSSLETDEITDYSINEGNHITLFYNTRKDEIITIKFKNGTVIQTFITNSFEESNDEGYLKKFIDVDNLTNNEYVLDLPYSAIPVDKYLVFIERPNGYRYPITNFKIYKDKIYIPTNSFFNVDDDSHPIIANDRTNWKIFISIIDYSKIYDKIYTWEDLYGISNNKFAWENYYRNNGLTQFISGNDFLDPHYNEDRPSELSVVYPQNNLFVYTSKANEQNNNFAARNVFNFDFKNNQLYKRTYSKTAKLVNEFKIGDTEIVVSKDVFDKPYYEGDKLMPSLIVIKSEMIEFYDYTLNEDETITLRKLRRGINGTFINKICEENSIVYPFTKTIEHEYNLTPSYYFIKNQNNKEYIINGNIQHKEFVNVYKTSNISLLSEINKDTTSFIISDNSIELPVYDNENNLIKKGYLFINNEKIFFDTITQNNDMTYTISNFTNPYNKTFEVGSQIPSNKYIQLTDNDYTITTEKYEKLDKTKNAKFKNTLILNNNPNIGECIIVENYNKNVFD